jgi:hypothetical protein
MPVDPNEAPEGMISCISPNGKACSLCAYRYELSPCASKYKCISCLRNDKQYVYFIKKPQETKTMENEYEYLTADTAENCKTLVDWVFAGECEIRTTSISREFGHKFLSVVWISADTVVRNREYRRKKPAADVLPLKKVKKLIDRNQEDFWPLIGQYWARNKDGRRYIIACDHWNHAADSQANWEIAPLGTEEWGPMQKTVEVDA